MPPHPVILWLIITSPISACLILGLLMGLRIRKLKQYGLWTECPGCGYSLEGLGPGVPCPECGLADPRNAPREILRPRFRWTGTVILCFGAAAFVTLVFLDLTYQSVIEDTWNSFRRFDRSHQFTRYVALAHTPATLGIWMVAIPIAAIAYLAAKRGRPMRTSVLEMSFLATAHIGLCALGFFLGLLVAWFDAENRHERILIWTYGGALVGALLGAVVILVFARTRRVEPPEVPDHHPPQ